MRLAPSDAAHLNKHGTIRIELKTTSRDAARHEREAMMLAGDEYWHACKRMDEKGPTKDQDDDCMMAAGSRL